MEPDRLARLDVEMESGVESETGGTRPRAADAVKLIDVRFAEC
jgi:hypothetical protein